MSSTAAMAQPLESLVDRLWAMSPSAAEAEAARLRTFDAATAMVLGARLGEWASAARTFRRLVGGVGTSTASDAAVLASCCRLTEVDDIHLGSCTTPGSVVVPVVLALASAGAAATDLLSGVVIGYEAVVSAAELLGGAFAPERGVWPTRAAAALGAAVTAARSIGLDREAAREALALAACFDVTGRLPEPSRAWSLGVTVMSGVAAALGAAEGLRADRAALESWADGRGRSGDAPPRLARREAPAVAETCVKPFCGARQALAAVSLVRALVETGAIAPTAVVLLSVGLPSRHVAMVSGSRLRRRLDTLASLRYLVSLAITEPAALDDMDHPAETGEAINRLMERVRVERAADLDALFPSRWGASVTVTLADRVERRAAQGVPGERELSWQSLDEKRHRLCARAAVSGQTLDEVKLALQRDEFARVTSLLGDALEQAKEEGAWPGCN